MTVKNVRVRAIARRAAVILAAVSAGCQPQPPIVPNDGVIPAANQRVAFQSQCAQNVVECTTSWPTAVATVVAGQYQTVTETASGFLVTTTWGSGAVPVQFRGSDSEPGQTATTLEYSWSFGATDDDPCTLAPGTVVSTDSDPELMLEPGFHYIRLTVVNDVIRDQVISDQCGLIGENIGSFDFVELEVEVRRM